MSELGRDLGQWIGRGIIETTEDLTDAFVDVPAQPGFGAAGPAAAADSSKKPTPAPPKPSASWFFSLLVLLRGVAFNLRFFDSVSYAYLRLVLLFRQVWKGFQALFQVREGFDQSGPAFVQRLRGHRVEL